MAGANLKFRECPQSYRDITQSECCEKKDDDCIFRYVQYHSSYSLHIFT